MVRRPGVWRGGATLLVAFLAGCGGVSAPDGGADLLFLGGAVWTGVPGAPRAQAVAIREGRVLAVGSDDSIRSLAGPGAEIVDLNGRFVMPGFIDAHTHFLEGGFRLAAVDLRDADSREEVARRLRAYAASQPPGRWITGGDWDHERWGGTLPDRSWIDAATPDHPVFVTRLDWHMALANSRAMELAGVDASTPDPPGGEIVRDSAGRPTGVFKDEAMQLVERAIPEPSDSERDSALAAAMRHAASLGVTGVHDMGSWEGLETYRRARSRGTLTLRVYAYVPLSTVDRLARFVESEGGTGDDWLRWGGLKGFVDGSLGSGTALFDEPYSDEPANTGLRVTPVDELRAQVRRADAAGLQVAVHAIGDRANAEILDIYEELERDRPPRDRRYRVEHAQHLRPADVERFARLGVIPSMQPYHAVDDGRWAERRIGPERARTTYAFRSLFDGGAHPAFGSDWTVAPLDPLLGVHAAVTRATLDGARPGGWVPAEKLDVERALLGYTANAARAGFAERRVGTLEPGALADLVVIDGDPFEVAPSELGNLRVDRTIVGGRTVWIRENGGADPED